MIQRFCFLLMAGGFLALPSAVTRPNEEVVTERLVIVDSEGRPRIVAEAGTFPRLVFKNDAGEDSVILAVGGEVGQFPFDQKNVPHLTLQTGLTKITLSVSPAPEVEGLNEEVLVESAYVSFSSAQETSEGKGLTGKIFTLGIYPNKASFSISTMSPEKPIFEMNVNLFIDTQGNVTTYLGDREQDR